MFREPVQQVLEKIKNELFFKWPNKMVGDPMRRNQSLYCHYHQDHGHTTEDCRNLWDHLDKLVQEGRLKQLLHHSSGRGSQMGSTFQGDASSRLLLGTINVIFVALGRTGSYPSRVMSVSCCLDEDSNSMSKRVKTRIPLVLGFSDEDSNSMPKRIKKRIPSVLGFSDEDKLGTIKPHDDALVVTLKISGYDVRRVMIDQGSAAEIMYHDLFKGLKLKPKNLTAYSSPLVSFKGKMIIPKGQIRLLMQTGSDVVEVDFIVVDTFSPYTAIMGRP